MTLLRSLLCALVALGLSSAALADDGSAPTGGGSKPPGARALVEFRQGHGRPDAVQNRFFLKTGRFEIAPSLGYVPNNPFAKRYVGGLLVAYHFSEVLAAEGAFTYAPDLGSGDYKSLLYTLVNIAATGASNTSFVQPFDKSLMGATFSARWAPLYGKINLVGETVVNFDLYGVGGLGILTKANFDAKSCDQADCPATGVAVDNLGTVVRPTPVIGAGFDFFANQAIAVKLDARSQFYVDDIPDYHPDKVDATDGKKKVFSNFCASVGVAFYFPKMQPRLYTY